MVSVNSGGAGAAVGVGGAYPPGSWNCCVDKRTEMLRYRPDGESRKLPLYSTAVRCSVDKA